MSGCPVHPSDDRTSSRSRVLDLPWELIFLVLATGMLVVVIGGALWLT